mgnify:CR=1 FL=1|tara:strand:+ start:22897 stop:23364 length:468 start_codon:yes stop_codon:yes gene_type:complete
MYRGHSNWDEDKLDIHSSSYASHSSEESDAGYTGSSKDSTEEYHKNEVYSANKPEEDKIKDSYKSNEKDDDKKKEDEENEKTIVDTVEQEEKYQKNDEEEEDEFQTVAKNIQQGNAEDQNIKEEKGKEAKKKNSKNIEEAIKDAIKEEKEVVHVD